ncbi:MAG: tetratricopeptide repeat protein [Verrucomicrobiae bacterium]|nr:tetratricopeptide repeat protein [Verrucomicrobiae bacterium]
MRRNIFVAIALAAQCVCANAATIQTRTGVYRGEITHIQAGTVFIKQEQGEFGISIRDILRIELERPAAYDQAVAALRTGKPQDAVAALKPVVDRYAGLPVPWLVEAFLRLGDAYLDLKDTKSAAATFDRLKQLYPSWPQVQAVDVKNARVLLNLQKYDEALKVIKSYLEPQLKKDFLPADQEVIVAEALVIQGDCLLAMQKPYEAMDSYLLVVTLFDYDDARAAEARFKVAQILEQTGNPKRAREEYEDLVKEAPDSPFAAEAKKRIAELAKANPQ